MLVPAEKKSFLNLLHSRQVFAYPTEAVYGIGGDPRAPEVFAAILRLKGARQPGQGMLLVAANWAQCAAWVDGLDAALIAQLQAEGLPVFGTYSPDGFFGAGAYRHFDAVLAMYHDQGLAPFKALSMEDGVNFTAGLNIVRTSPDHGTAFDIAGKGVASELSLLQAIYAAIDIYRHRLSYDEVNANPLPFAPRHHREDRRLRQN